MTATLAPKQRKTRKALRGPQALPAVPEAVLRLEIALLHVDAAWRLLDAAGRQEDVFQIGRYINDLRYRLLPRVRAVACSECPGYRVGLGEEAPGMRCRHMEASDEHR